MERICEAERMLIGGELVESVTGEWITSINPATEEPIGRVPAGSSEDVDRAVQAAEKAWPAWAALTPMERAAAMNRFADAIAARAEEILRIEVSDTGNTIRPMRMIDVPSAVESLRYYAGLAPDLRGDTIPATSDNLHLTMHEPYGVVARIAPFNHPIMFAVARTAAALAAGNAVIVKPPETSPLSAMVLAEIARDTLPPGVFNIVTGDGAVVGNAIVRHLGIKRIAFIGSPETGRAIQRSAAEVAVKHITLELGGKNPMIVFPDCDPEKIADAAVFGMNFSWQGQSCGSLSRLLLHEDIYDRVLKAVVERVAALRIGDPLSDETDVGPVNSELHMQRILAHCANADADGARRMLGGGRPEGEQFRKGYWVAPTVYADVTPELRLWQQEVFGPVMAIGRWRDFEEAVAMANSTEYGLTAAVWTHDINAALKMARRIRSGHIWINGSSMHFLGVPFGGMKSSGVGREEGRDELLSYTESKTINIMLS
ncbi:MULTISPECIES: aldehyde dehydrogenase family protein [Halomonadaceae]|uniref:2-formylbenzoate dehydrogenase n=3 Tax=Vreelandella TaxID=3137766 RepID=A0AAP9T1C5_9GAMM|nr:MULTISPECIES: aldehyde dehydrogenase family protein [Halomonas]QKS24738.1 2-formylbenzoate dehydrogenase [Halomonas titanicae]|tara:strand:+ start:3305 stop:4762 length:1458 start_codon:yes stop_codon:yes gene_type:complete